MNKHIKQASDYYTSYTELYSEIYYQGIDVTVVSSPWPEPEACCGYCQSIQELNSEPIANA